MSNNMTPITRGIYLVRTQAGFKQAPKDYFGADDGEWEQDGIYGYPKKYPAVVSLSPGYNGGFLALCNSVHVNRLKEVIEDV